MEKYDTWRKIAFRITIVLLVIDIAAYFLITGYTWSLFYILFFGHTSGSLITQYSKYKDKDPSFSKLTFALYIMFFSFSVYSMARNLVILAS